LLIIEGFDKLLYQKCTLKAVILILR